MYRTVKAVAFRLREKWGIEMDLWMVASNCKRVMMDERVVPRVKQLVVKTVEDFTVALGNDVFKILAVISLDTPPVLTSGSIVLGEIIFPPQTFWVSDDVSMEITSEELMELNALPYFRGPYVPFNWNPPNLEFNYDKMEVGIVYSAVAKDEDGFVLIPEDMVEALANYCAEVHLKPLFLLGKVPMGIYKEIQDESNNSFGNGKWNMMMRGLDQGQIDKLLDTMTSMDRKSFNIDA
jgi:hypothetical protein